MFRMDFHKFYFGLTKPEREAFCKRAGFSPGYLHVHLTRGTRVPRPSGIVRLAKASRGAFTADELFAWFLANDAKG